MGTCRWREISLSPSPHSLSRESQIISDVRTYLPLSITDHSSHQSFLPWCGFQDKIPPPTSPPLHPRGQRVFLLTVNGFIMFFGPPWDRGSRNIIELNSDCARQFNAGRYSAIVEDRKRGGSFLSYSLSLYFSLQFLWSSLCTPSVQQQRWETKPIKSVIDEDHDIIGGWDIVQSSNYTCAK